MGKSDKTKDEGIIGDRKGNKHIAETDCCADGSCGWNANSTARSDKEDKAV